MKIEKLFPHIRLDSNVGNLELRGISRDSRRVVQGDMFFIIEGKSFDIFNALKSIEDKVCVFLGEKKKKDIISSLIKRKPIIYLEDIAGEFRRAVDLFYDYPQKSLNFIGITGTNGKSTIAYLIYTLLMQLEGSASLIGTVNYYLKNRKVESSYTTPDYLSLRKLFSLMREDNNKYVVMEVSSHGINQERIQGIAFSQCVFTNLTRDHLDYHKTMKNYFTTKKELFLQNSQAVSFINLDDVYGRRLLTEIKNKKITFAIKANADFKARGIKISKKGTEFILDYRKVKFKVTTPLLGEHNVSNLLAVISSVVSLGIDLEAILEFLPRLGAPCGRLEAIDKDVFVDYAHTPQALEKVLYALKEAGYKKMICVFGCGGDRDRGKRPLMGEICSSLADFSIITSDNPRSESAYEISCQIKEGFKKNNCSIVLDRKEAISTALEMKKNQDCAVLVAGKGHEDYQIVGDKRVPFKDQEVIRELLSKKSS